jgi:cell growth-regulating nucleolar protein
MVVFTCNNCGESLKKQVVEKHKFACSSRFVSVSCMDCFKDFNESDYNQHVQCITELERYSGKDFVPKANQNKGQKKQEAWVIFKVEKLGCFDCNFLLMFSG